MLPMNFYGIVFTTLIFEKYFSFGNNWNISKKLQNLWENQIYEFIILPPKYRLKIEQENLKHIFFTNLDSIAKNVHRQFICKYLLFTLPESFKQWLNIVKQF